MTPEEAQFRRAVRLKLLASPWTLLPILAGITDLLALWTFSIESGAGIFAGIAGILGGFGIFMTRLLLGSDEINRETFEEMEAQQRQKRERKLDDLDKKLVEDTDPRTESALRDLRAMAELFHSDTSWKKALDPRSVFDILTGVERLFNQCVQLLEKSLELWYTARRMRTVEAREPILAERERIIREIGVSIRQLGKVFAGIGKMSAGQDVSMQEMKRLREELDRNLEVAEKVRNRMQSLNRELGSDVSTRGGLDDV